MGQFCILWDLAGVYHRYRPTRFFTFFVNDALKSHSSRRGDSPLFLLLLTKDKLHSMLTTSDSVAMAVGEQIQNPSIVLRRGVGRERGGSGRGEGGLRVESRADSFVPRSAARSSRLSGSSGFSSNTLRPHFGPPKKILASVAPAALATSASQIPRSVWDVSAFCWTRSRRPALIRLQRL